MDTSEQLAAAIVKARESGGSLAIGGAGSKSSIRPKVSGDLLITTDMSGIVHYDPAELVITARAGTPLRDLSLALHQHDQTLLCDPPRFHGGGTVGGAVAAGLSGPGRPWHGAVRDAVLIGAPLVGRCPGYASASYRRGHEVETPHHRGPILDPPCSKPCSPSPPRSPSPCLSPVRAR